MLERCFLSFVLNFFFKARLPWPAASIVLIVKKLDFKHIFHKIVRLAAQSFTK